jgi:hypothetical protein
MTFVPVRRLARRARAPCVQRRAVGIAIRSVASPETRERLVHRRRKKRIEHAPADRQSGIELLEVLGESVETGSLRKIPRPNDRTPISPQRPWARLLSAFADASEVDRASEPARLIVQANLDRVHDPVEWNLGVRTFGQVNAAREGVSPLLSPRSPE